MDARPRFERGIITRAPPSMVRAVRRIVIVDAPPTRRDDADVAAARIDTFPVARIVVVVVIIIGRSIVRSFVRVDV